MSSLSYGRGVRTDSASTKIPTIMPAVIQVGEKAKALWSPER